MGKRILLLGDTGKLGGALRGAFAPGDEVLCASSRTFDACDVGTVSALIDSARPDRVYNAVAMLGIDACERDPKRALYVNALFPRMLARLSSDRGFVLVHFGTDAVFDGDRAEAWTERDAPCPPNVYGLTKHGGDCFVLSEAEGAYLFRVSLLFGLAGRGGQFVEKMIDDGRGGSGTLRVADDIILSPTFAEDAARAAVRMVDEGYPGGLYHLANGGRASLYELMARIASGLGLAARIERASCRDFPSAGKKNTFTPIRSERIAPLRPWEEAVDAYCSLLKEKGRTGRG